MSLRGGLLLAPGKSAYDLNKRLFALPKFCPAVRQAGLFLSSCSLPCKMTSLSRTQIISVDNLLATRHQNVWERKKKELESSNAGDRKQTIVPFFGCQLCFFSLHNLLLNKSQVLFLGQLTKSEVENIIERERERDELSNVVLFQDSVLGSIFPKLIPLVILSSLIALNAIYIQAPNF